MSNFVSIAWTYVPLNPCLSRFTNRALLFAPSESRSGTQNWSQGSQNAILRIPQIANLRYNLGLADNPGAPGIFAAPQICKSALRKQALNTYRPDKIFDFKIVNSGRPGSWQINSPIAASGRGVSPHFFRQPR